MSKYSNMAFDALQFMWEEKRRRIAELPFKDRLPKDIEELTAMRKEIDKRKDIRKPSASVDFASDYLTD